ncbi:MAG: hypothetical protein SWJ54_14995 [Cyanobacteriota bacterium]|nr:hypothetical protein [Cyanobacteriota bacterium]
MIKSIEFNLIHPLFAQSWVDAFDPLLPKLWSKNVVMFHIGRSGSSVLGKLLNETNEIIWDEEIYHFFLEKVVKPQKKHSSGIINFPFDPIKLVRNRMLVRRLFHPLKKIYGCEIKFYHLRKTQIELEKYLDYLEYLGFKDWIILERRNYLRVLVSSIISNRKMKPYHIAAGENPQLVQVHLNIESTESGRKHLSLLESLQNHQHDFQHLEYILRDRHTLKLTYEDDIEKDPRIAARRICKFLNIPNQDSQPVYGKTNPFSLKEIIINFEEVQQVLDGTPFEWMLYE